MDLLGTLTASMPGVLSRADTALVATTETINAAQALLTQPDSDLSQTFASIRASADALTGLLDAQQGSLTAVIDDIQTISSTVASLAEDSLSGTIQHANALLTRLDYNLTELEKTTGTLNDILNKINSGEGHARTSG